MQAGEVSRGQSSAECGFRALGAFELFGVLGGLRWFRASVGRGEGGVVCIRIRCYITLVRELWMALRVELCWLHLLRWQSSELDFYDFRSSSLLA